MGSYRYGFNGQEKSSEVGASNYTAQFWEYDSRIGRRWNLDPEPITGISEYATLNNSPILYSDPLGNVPIGPGPSFISVWPAFQRGSHAANFGDVRFKGWDRIGHETAASVAGVANGLNSTLSVGLYVRSPESLGIHEQYASHFYAGTLVGSSVLVLPGAGGGAGTAMS